MADFVAGEPLSVANGSKTHSRDSSMSSERSNKENGTDGRTNGQTGRRGSDSGSDRSNGQLILKDGGRLREESKTENIASGLHNLAFNGMRNGDSESHPEVPPRQPLGLGGSGTAKTKVAKSGNQAVSTLSIPEEEITIPPDGNLASFTADAMATFLRYFKLEDRLVNHLHRQGLDGKKFGRLKDTDLDNLHLRQNPVVVYFRDRTAPSVSKKPAKQRLPFVL